MPQQCDSRESDRLNKLGHLSMDQAGDEQEHRQRCSLTRPGARQLLPTP